MKFRKLRIAFSATCLIACVVLIALWVRSYFYPLWVAYGDMRVHYFKLVDGKFFYGRLDEFAVPFWLMVAVTTTVAVAPWLPWRFSLRSLLVATTLVAVVLGLIIFAVRI